ncbi:MAG: coproporphyrinogen III oxidase [Acidobacteria bacterium]|nr:MAG: coproporphyrinogen III oxidase [Acidobacteriota bacterium]
MIATTPVHPDAPELADYCAGLFGIYVHVPFCTAKCGYCDFASFDGMSDLAGTYVEGLCQEVSKSGISSCDTVFVGGGTPTSLGPDLLGKLIAAIPRSDEAEVTVEANPESLTADVAIAAAAAGANRISIGMQSALPHVLKSLGRRHNFGAVAAAVDAARGAGIGRLNLDLIYGAPGEALADWRQSLDAAIALDPGHISAYSLTVEAGTKLWRQVRDGHCRAPDDDSQAEKMSVAAEILANAGYVRYEVSAWAKPGEACRHNLMYWGGGEYRGFGSGAHSHIGGTRFWNHRDPRSYLSDLGVLSAGSERITSEIEVFDRVSLGMRRAAGVSISELPRGCEGAIDFLSGAGLVLATDGRLRPTAKGFALGNEIVIRLLSVAGSEC